MAVSRALYVDMRSRLRSVRRRGVCIEAFYVCSCMLFVVRACEKRSREKIYVVDPYVSVQEAVEASSVGSTAAFLSFPALSM